MRSSIKNNLSEKYSNGTVFIHWISLLLILILIPSGFIMANTRPEDGKIFLLRLHVFIGATVFVLTLFRVYFFFKHKRPARLETGNYLHNRMIVWIENSFYIVLLLLAISGILTIVSGGLGQAIKTADYTILPEKLDVPPLTGHQSLAKLLMALLIVHIIGVANHYIKFKENTLKRILPR